MLLDILIQYNGKKLSHPHRFKGLLCNRGTDNTDNWACRVTNQYPCHNHPKPSRPPSKWPWVCQQNPIARCGSCNLTAGFAAYCCNSSFSTQFVGVMFFLNQAWTKGILHLCHILLANLACVQEAKCLHHDQKSFPRSGATHRSSRWQTHTPWNTQALGASWPQSVEIGSGVMQVYSYTLQMYQISMSFDFGSVDWSIMLQGYLQNMFVFLYRLQPPWTVWWSGVVKIRLATSCRDYILNRERIHENSTFPDINGLMNPIIFSHDVWASTPQKLSKMWLSYLPLSPPYDFRFHSVDSKVSGNGGRHWLQWCKKCSSDLILKPLPSQNMHIQPFPLRDGFNICQCMPTAFIATPTKATQSRVHNV